jgi:hypothetical protein
MTGQTNIFCLKLTQGPFDTQNRIETKNNIRSWIGIWHRSDGINIYKYKYLSDDVFDAYIRNMCIGVNCP